MNTHKTYIAYDAYVEVSLVVACVKSGFLRKILPAVYRYAASAKPHEGTQKYLAYKASCKRDP